MLKKLLITVTVVAVLLMIALSYILGRGIDKEEIARAKLEMAQLKAARDSINMLAAYKDSIQVMLKYRVRELDDQADVLRKQVDLIEEQRKEDQLTVRKIRKPEDLKLKFQNTYPELAHSNWGVTEVYNEKQDVSLEYLLIPLWFSETFIIQDQNSTAYKNQVEKLQMVDSLQQQVSALKDSVLQLEVDKRIAYQNGYDEAYSKYEDLNEKYRELLAKPPSVEFGVPQWGAIIGGAAAGFYLGTKVK